MAYTHKGPGPKAGLIYNVEQSVGKGSVNAAGDVKLVQYMIRHIYGAQAAGLAVDGYIGPTTISWIERFQKDAKAQGNNVLADGRIDRALAQISTVSKTTYAIIVMNMKLRQCNPGAYQSLPQAVPLSSNPKANPYNPAAKQVVDVKSAWSTLGKVITYFYSDGTQQKTTLSKSENGKLIFDPPVPGPPEPKPGKLIFDPVVPQAEIINVIYYPKMNATQYIYADGDVDWFKGPPGGLMYD